MQGKVLLSTAYLPPAEYFARILKAEEVLIEREENYLKQSYRNRCYILSPSGIQALTVPVYLGSIHKTVIRDIRIDYSKRWQKVHIGAISSSYGSSPFFIYFYEIIEKIILGNYQFLLDLNMDLLTAILKMMSINVGVSYTTEFSPVAKAGNDFRYSIGPKKKPDYNPKPYIQVFSHVKDHTGKLSIIDLLFNAGPDLLNYL